MSSSGYGFLDAERVANEGKSKPFPGSVQVYLYDRLIYKKCPHPYNPEALKVVEDFYHDGQFVGRDSMWITKEQVKEFELQ